MKTLDRIPTKKTERVARLLKTGAKLGVNYLKYYEQRLTKDEKDARQTLNKSNAEEVYNNLKELKGSALKVAQMLSMEKDIMPKDFVDKFSLSQFSVPALSGALVRKVFRRYFGKNPEELFDSFSPEARNAASIGQVHQAVKDGQKLAVKIQYPGVRESISTDLAMVKPVAMKMFNIRKKGSEQYFKEVEDKLLEETDYTLELKRSQEFAKKCRHLPKIKFPHYYPAYSCDRILTMDWMSGKHLSEFLDDHPSQQERNRIGQVLWDFYMYQLHHLKKLHADPHPGNFLVDAQNNLLVIDFGCVKEITDSFYTPYFELTEKENIDNPKRFAERLDALEVLLPEDSPEERQFFTQIFRDMLGLFTRPYRHQYFDFSNDHYFEEIASIGQRYTKLSEIRKMNTNRGSRHFIYMNRTFFGLFNLMHDLKAEHIQIHHYKDFTDPLSISA